MKFKSVILLALVLLLTACGGGIEGTYSGPYTGKILSFQSNGKASFMGVGDLDYEVDGKNIKLHMPTQVVVLKILDDGSIQFPLLGKLTKVSS